MSVVEVTSHHLSVLQISLIIIIHLYSSTAPTQHTHVYPSDKHPPCPLPPMNSTQYIHLHTLYIIYAFVTYWYTSPHIYPPCTTQSGTSITHTTKYSPKAQLPGSFDPVRLFYVYHGQSLSKGRRIPSLFKSRLYKNQHTNERYANNPWPLCPGNTLTLQRGVVVTL